MAPMNDRPTATAAAYIIIIIIIIIIAYRDCGIYLPYPSPGIQQPTKHCVQQGYAIITDLITFYIFIETVPTDK
jgi:hypothetical protein